MKFYISYFWNIRNLPPKAIPISTARFDPAWYHSSKGPKYQFIDSNGVYNGLRAEVFAPTDKLEGLNQEAFLEGYYNQLCLLDFNEIKNRLENLTNKVGEYLGVTGPVPVLIVHEAPDNPYSERWALIGWFANNGVELKEFPTPPKKSAKPKRQEVYNF